MGFGVWGLGFGVSGLGHGTLARSPPQTDKAPYNPAAKAFNWTPTGLGTLDDAFYNVKPKP